MAQFGELALQSVFQNTVLQCPRLAKLTMESFVGLMFVALPAGGAPGDSRVLSPCVSRLRKLIVNKTDAKLPQLGNQQNCGPPLSLETGSRRTPRWRSAGAGRGGGRLVRQSHSALSAGDCPPLPSPPSPHVPFSTACMSWSRDRLRSARARENRIQQCGHLSQSGGGAWRDLPPLCRLRTLRTPCASARCAAWLGCRRSVRRANGGPRSWNVPRCARETARNWCDW